MCRNPLHSINTKSEKEWLVELSLIKSYFTPVQREIHPAIIKSWVAVISGGSLCTQFCLETAVYKLIKITMDQQENIVNASVRCDAFFRATEDKIV